MTPEPTIWTLLEAAYDEVRSGSRGRYPAQIALERAITALDGEVAGHRALAVASSREMATAPSADRLAGVAYHALRFAKCRADWPGKGTSNIECARDASRARAVAEDIHSELTRA